jgi:hypothetical protein
VAIRLPSPQNEQPLCRNLPRKEAGISDAEATQQRGGQRRSQVTRTWDHDCEGMMFPTRQREAESRGEWPCVGKTVGGCNDDARIFIRHTCEKFADVSRPIRIYSVR